MAGAVAEQRVADDEVVHCGGGRLGGGRGEVGLDGRATDGATVGGDPETLAVHDQLLRADPALGIAPGDRFALEAGDPNLGAGRQFALPGAVMRPGCGVAYWTVKPSSAWIS